MCCSVNAPVCLVCCMFTVFHQSILNIFGCACCCYGGVELGVCLVTWIVMTSACVNEHFYKCVMPYR